MGEQSSGASRKPWYWVGGAVVVTAFLGAAGTAGFNWLSDTVTREVDDPLNANLTPFTETCERFVIDRSHLEQVPVDANGDIDEAWVAGVGGLQAGPRLLRLTLVGDADTSVVVDSVTVTDVTEYPLPPDPVLVGECSPGGGEMTDRIMSLDFTTRQVEISNTDGTPVSTVTIGGGATPETFLFGTQQVEEGAEHPCFCTWRLEVAWTSSSDDGTLKVDLDGEPIALVPTASGWDNYWFEGGVLRTY